MDSPQWLPDGESVLFSVTTATGAERWDEARVVVQSLATGERTVVLQGGSDARYVSTGHLVYALEDGLFAVAFDADRLTVQGGVVSVVQRVMRAGNPILQTAAAHYGISEQGTLVYLSAGAAAAPQHTLVWVDREGREEPLAAPARAYYSLNISPDGTRVALGVSDQDHDIWIWDLAREVLTRLTFDPGNDRWPVWTLDGRRVVFESRRESGEANLFWTAADGTGEVERLGESTNSQTPLSFSPDGRLLLFRENFPETDRDLLMLSMEDERATEVLLRTEFQEQNAELSPDGRWLAYQSNVSGQHEVEVRPFPDVDSGRWQVSTAGGRYPLWTPDGRELFYVDPDGRVMAVTVQADATFTPGIPQVLFEGNYYFEILPRNHDIAPDGQRFLMIKEVESESDQETSQASVIVVQNWFEELRRLVPVP